MTGRIPISVILIEGLVFGCDIRRISHDTVIVGLTENPRKSFRIFCKIRVPLIIELCFGTERCELALALRDLRRSSQWRVPK